MRKSTITVLAAFTAIISFTSCSIEKRVHRKGYHVEWNKSSTKVQDQMAIQHEKEQQEVVTAAAATPFITTDPTSFASHAKATDNTTHNADVLLEATASINAQEQVQLSTSPKTFESTSPSSSAKGSKVQTQFQENTEIEQPKSASKAEEGGTKSRVVALVLCFFLGALGIHRFYLGYTGMGILYLLTLGLFGFGVIIDFIRLLIKPGLQPKNGSYENE